MSKTKAQRGLCEFHGCQRPGIVRNEQSICQQHRDAFEQSTREHESRLAQIHEWGRQRRARMQAMREYGPHSPESSSYDCFNSDL